MTKVVKNSDAGIDDAIQIVRRGAVDLIDESELRATLRGGRKLRV